MTAERPTHKKCRQCGEWFNLSKRASLKQKFCCGSCAATYRTSDPKWRKAQSEKIKAQCDSEVMRERSRKAWDDPETRAYLTEKTRERANTKEHKAYMLEHNKKMWADPEFRAAQTESKRKRSVKQWEDPAFREKMSAVTTQTNKKRWADPEFKKRTGFRIKLALAQPLEKKRKSAESKERMNRPENRARASEQAKQQWENPEYRAFMSGVSHETAVKRWQDPVYRKQQIANLKKASQSPEHRARMSEQGKRLATDPVAIARRKAWWDAGGKAKQIEANKKRWADPEYKARVSKAISEAKRKPKP